SYAFLCIFHPEMRGSIEVVGSESTTPKQPTISKPPTAPSPTATPTPTAAPSTDANEPTAVQIFDLGFEPQTLGIVEGTKVRWTNAGAAPHTVTAGDGAFDSGTLQSGDAFDFTFTSPGTYAYACQVHPGMQGTMEVTG